MDYAEITRLRLSNQGLRTPFAGEPQEVVERFAAMQAQEFAYAKWSIAQRMAGIGEADVDRAFAEGRILRTHVLRPTWHFVAARDIRWLMMLSGPRVHALNKHYYGKYGLDGRLLAKAANVLVKALEDGSQLTRDELDARLRRSKIEAAGPRLVCVMMYAELEGLICSGAVRGKRQTYALLEHRAPAAKALSQEEALAELMRRYFLTRGPATLRDFTTWSSLTMRDGKRGLEIVSKGLERAEADGRVYWFAAGAAPPRRKEPVVDLLQAYDEYGMSYSESRDVLREPGLEIPTGATPMHLLMLDGRLIGRWRHALKKGGVDIETSLYRPLHRAEARALEKAVERYRVFKAAS